MTVLLLGSERHDLITYLESFCDRVIFKSEKISASSALLDQAEFIISYGYRHIIKADILERFERRAINLHISYLPWNKGADPNLWSFIDDTPKGVTIHFLDAGVDTGDIIAQKEVEFSERDTLKTSYDKLSSEIVTLFKKVWPEIRAGRLKGKRQVKGGSKHFSRDRKKVEHLLQAGFDTPVIDLIGRGKEIKV